MPCGWSTSHFLNDSLVKGILDSWTIQLWVWNFCRHRTSCHFTVVFPNFLIYFIGTPQWPRYTCDFTADMPSPALGLARPADWCIVPVQAPKSQLCGYARLSGVVTTWLPPHYQDCPEQCLTYVGERLWGKKARLEVIFPNKTQSSSSFLVGARKGK